MDKYVMALDQGTTSSRCILFDKTGQIVSMSQKEFPQIYPNPGWVEHDPMEIWSSQCSVAVEAIASIGLTPDQIEAIGITNQRETTIVWDADTGKPIYNAIVWQCRRTSDIMEKMIEEGWSEYVKEHTGLLPDAYFSASKIAWILDNVEGARERAQNGELRFGTVDTWLIWNLTGGQVHATDYTNASRTMLFNIHELKWDEKIMDYFGIPMSMMPDVLPSSALFGETLDMIFGRKIPISGVAGDQQAALFGQCGFEKGDVKNTYGTGCFLLMNTGKEPITSKNGLLTTIAAGSSDKPDYVLEGSVFIGGAAIQWLRDGLKIIEKASDTQEIAESAEDTAGAYFVPAFTGLGAPYWNMEARGTFTGITRGCEKKHFVRAVLESIAYQVNDVLKAMQDDAGVRIRLLRVDGGASANTFLMQFEADILGTSVLRPRCIETTALGAAYLAGLYTGYWKDLQEIRDNWQLDETFTPQMERHDAHRLVDGWDKAVKTTLYAAKLYLC